MFKFVMQNLVVVVVLAFGGDGAVVGYPETLFIQNLFIFKK